MSHFVEDAWALGSEVQKVKSSIFFDISSSAAASRSFSISTSTAPMSSRVDYSQFFNMSTNQMEETLHQQNQRLATKRGAFKYLTTWLADEGTLSSEHFQGECPLFDQIWSVAFDYLELESIFQCQIVSREWYAVVNQVHFWVKIYNRKYRPTLHSLPLLPEFTAETIRQVVGERYHQEYTLSTRAKAWTRPNGVIIAHNDSITRSFAAGSIESLKTDQSLEALPFAKACGRTIAYFEAKVRGGASIGLAARSSIDYGYGEQNHVGWAGVSYGYHSNDGEVFWNDGTSRYGGQHRLYGPIWSDSSNSFNLRTQPDQDLPVVGCGYDKDRKRVFYTLNGEFLGEVDVEIVDEEFAAAVALHELGDALELNFGSIPFVFDIEEYCLAQA